MKSRNMFLTLVVTLTVISLLAGCGGTPTPAPQPTAAKPAATAAPTATAVSKWPEGAVTLVMGFGTGGQTDTNVRGFAPYLQKALGVTVLIDNRPGNNGLLAANYVYEKKPDGYTLFIGTSGVATVAQLLPDVWKPGKPLEEAFIPLYSWSWADGNAILVNKDAPWKTMGELVAEAQKRPIKFGIGGGWSSSDAVMAQMIKQAYGGEWIIVPMDSGGQVISGVLGGQFDAGSTGPTVAGMDPATLRVLAVSMQVRSGRWPDAPTFIELGKPTVSINQIVGALAPLGTPPDVVAKLVAAFEKARNDPEYLAWAQKTSQAIGDKGWDGATYGAALKTYTANVKPILPLLKAELDKAQGVSPTATPAAPAK